jgi:probable O-glycosylation ligase (exosortase A-associated)
VPEVRGPVSEMTEAPKKNLKKKLKTYSPWFVFTLLYLVIDYGRPQDILPIGFLRPAMFIILILTGFVLLDQKFLNPKEKQTKLIWAFIALLAVYVPFARNNFFAFQATASMLKYMPFILSAIVCVNSIGRLKSIMFVSTCIMIYVSCYSLFYKGVGSGNYFNDENDLALYVNMWLPYCYFLFASEKKKLKKIVYASGMLIGIASIVVSFSRGGLIGLICVFFVIWLFSPRKVISLVVVCLLAASVFFFASEKYWTKMETIRDTSKGTAHARLLSWEAAWDMFLDNPLGVGGNNFQARFPEYQSSEFRRGMWGRVAHSLWFTLIPELGIFGIIIYFLLLYYNIKDILYFKGIYKGKKDGDLAYLQYFSRGTIASFAGYFASGTFLSVLYYPHYWYLTAILVAATNIAKNIITENDSTQPKKVGFFERTHVSQI